VGNKRAVKLLIKAGADLNACNVRRLHFCGRLFFIEQPPDTAAVPRQHSASLQSQIRLLVTG
jgi:hypothetical protein